MEVDRAFQLIDKIETTMADSIDSRFFHPVVFTTLDNVNASRKEIDLLRDKIGDDIWMRLQGIAGSVYFGSLRRGEVSSFYDVVTRLGMDQTKAMIVALALYQYGRNEKDVEVIFARCYATAVMAQMLALQMGFREDAAGRAELGGLLLEIGKKMMVVYRKTFDHKSEEIDDDFIESYHAYLGERIVKRYAMPDYLRSIILARQVILEENIVSLPGVVYLAYDTVCVSFRKYDNRLVLKCQTPRPGTDVSRTLEAIIQDKFRALGLEQYLHIFRIPKIYDL
ncbi:MAG TPA: HDOD domain-containing protein [Syntrophales bacterium]|nr:HDOD domain-containing protein [Syntrophales bacterium]